MDLSVESIPLSLLDGSNPFQTRFWATLKSLNGWRGQAFAVDSAAFSGTVLVLVRSFTFGLSMAYVPMCFSTGVDDVFLLDFSRRLQRLLGRSVMLIRYDLDWANAEDGWDDFHICRSSVQPVGTVRIDLEGDLDFKDRVRRNLRKEDAVVVRRWDGDEDEFAAWYETYVHTAVRDHFSSRSMQYIRSIFDIRDQGVVPNLYIAYCDGSISGGIITLRSSGEEVYLFGSSVKHTGNVSCGYALQVHAIMEARRAGMKVYDLFGIDAKGEDGHLSSLTTFKTAFGGRKVYRPMTMDHDCRPLAARMFRVLDDLRYRHARRSRI